MAFFLFVDESGHDRKEAPYEVLAGIIVRDRDLWPLVNALHSAEIRNFGRRYSAGPAELKGRKLLKRKVFQHALLNTSVRPDEIAPLTKLALDDGENVNVSHLKALALDKIKYAQ